MKLFITKNLNAEFGAGASQANKALRNIKMIFSRKIFLPAIIFAVLGLIILDQAAKKTAILLLSGAPVSFGDQVSFEIYKNCGIAFGIPTSAGVFYFAVFLFFVLLASGKFLNFREMGKKETVAAAFILGGALGNIMDRIRLGCIVDFVNFKNIVIFNLADVFIAIGAIILLRELFQKNRQTDAVLTE